MSDTHEVLGAISAEVFLSEYWQKKPLLVRGALPEIQPLISADELAGLSLEEEVESRLVFERDAEDAWVVRHGPFTEEVFTTLGEQDWTLLVQGVDLWVPKVADLLNKFDFLPRWRLDDIMVSFAVPGGSVGPHFDQYDVFLLQVEGERSWYLGEECTNETPLLADTELRILETFQSQQEFLLAPGDMLYLPPRIAHWGVAQSECMTYSIGARSPLLADMLGDIAIEMLAQGEHAIYQDPHLTPQMATEEISAEFVQAVKSQMLKLMDDDELIADWFARFMTSPKYPGLEDLTQEQRTARIGSKKYVNGDC